MIACDVPALLGSIPSPSDGNLGPVPHVRPACSRSACSSATYVAERRWRRRGYPQGRHRRHRVLGRDRGRDRRPRCTTCSPTTSCSRTTRSARSRSGRAASSIWGAVIGGAIAVIVIARRRHLPTLVGCMDCIAPGLVLAQAIGRWGNWFNQELFGEADDAAVGARDRARAPAAGLRAVRDVPADVPLRVAVVPRDRSASLLLVDTAFALTHGQTFALYVVLYTFGRFLFENMRIDPAHDDRRLRFNAWVSIVVFVVRHRAGSCGSGRHEPEQRRPGDASSDATRHARRRPTAMSSGLPVRSPTEELPR